MLKSIGWCALVLSAAAFVGGCSSGSSGVGGGPVGGAGFEGSFTTAGTPIDVVNSNTVITLTSAIIPTADRLTQVTFSLADDAGDPIAYANLTDTRFFLAVLERTSFGAALDYRSYVTRERTSDSGATIVQGTYDGNRFRGPDSPGGLVDNGDGTFTYTFETALPEGYDTTATHQLGGQFRWVGPTDGVTYNSNLAMAFVPDGTAVVRTREIAATESCNGCHTRMAMHGSRREVGLCIMCHNRNSTARNDTTMAFSVMIHKLHRGVNLPGFVLDAEEYEIGGHTYGDLHFPQDIRNCNVCHDSGVASDADLHEDAPSRNGCASCHNRTWFGAPGGEPAGTWTDHVGGVQTDDAMCSYCHSPEAIDAIHDTTEPKLVLAVNGDTPFMVDGTGLVSVDFTAADSDGNAILDLDDTAYYRAGVLIAWPAQTDYTDNVGDSNIFDVKGDASDGIFVNNGDGTYRYTLPVGQEIPLGTTDSFGFTFRGRINASLITGDRVPMAVPEQVFFRTDGGTAEPRRAVVDDAACAKCHGADAKAGHGRDRVGAGTCVMCHNPYMTSTPDVGDTVTVNFKDMIHRIHTGEDLESGYTTGGHGGDVDFTEVRFPGHREECSICHLPGANLIPLPDGVGSTLVDGSAIADTSVLPGRFETLPIRAACTSCHDDVTTNSHTVVNTDFVNGVETCVLCHGPEGIKPVADVHGLAP